MIMFIVIVLILVFAKYTFASPQPFPPAWVSGVAGEASGSPRSGSALSLAPPAGGRRAELAQLLRPIAGRRAGVPEQDRGRGWPDVVVHYCVCVRVFLFVVVFVALFVLICLSRAQPAGRLARPRPRVQEYTLLELQTSSCKKKRKRTTTKSISHNEVVRANRSRDAARAPPQECESPGGARVREVFASQGLSLLLFVL